MAEISEDDTPWRKSSLSGSGNCVEVSMDANRVHVRDAKNRAAAPQSYSHAEWQAFTDGVKLGEFDLPPA